MIGIFDSGLGGLTVVRAIMDELPGYDITYFGDTARTPYGTKSLETVKRYTNQNIDFLIKKGAKIIIIACNSASSATSQEMLDQYNLPIFEVITPAVEYSQKISKNHAIGVIGTRATINSNIYENKLKKIYPNTKIYSYPCPLLVPLIEEGWLKKTETKMIVKKYLYPLKVRQIDTLILGCTHYPLLKKIIQIKIGKRVKIVDSSVTIAKKVKNYLKKSKDKDSKLNKNGSYSFFVSDITPQFEIIAKQIIKQNINLNHVKF